MTFAFGFVVGLAVGIPVGVGLVFLARAMWSA